MTESTDSPDDAAEQYWEIRFGVYCSPRQARELRDRIQRLLCPVPEHAGPCVVPWSDGSVPLDGHEAAEFYPELIEQVRIERGPR